MKHVYLKDVATLLVSKDKCIGCGMCAVVCPHQVFSITGKSAFITDKDRCMECGACALNCPVNAITVSVNVGCARAIISGWRAGTEPSCDCSGGDCC